MQLVSHKEVTKELKTTVGNLLQDSNDIVLYKAGFFKNLNWWTIILLYSLPVERQKAGTLKIITICLSKKIFKRLRLHNIFYQSTEHEGAQVN